MTNRTKQRAAGGGGTLLGLLWWVYSQATTAASLPADASAAAKMFSDPPIYLPWLVVAGSIIVLAWSFWPSKAPDEEDDESRVIARGSNAVAVGKLEGNLTYHAHAAHPKFSGVFDIIAIPRHLGGVSTIDLDGVATLRLFPPYSIDTATLALDAVPMRQPDAIMPGAEFRNIQITTGNPRMFSFDTGPNRRHTMEAGGKVFIVTLRETEALNIQGVANPLKFVFAVKEA